jgi:uncharacterized membrane protein YjfL (UPF0719 family)
MSGQIRWEFGACVTAGLVFVAASLWFWGAAEIREDPGKIIFLTFFAGFWLAITMRLFPWLGLSFRDDAVERRNDAALVALCGAVLAVCLVYAGGSVGEGPSVVENFFCAGIGLCVLFALWIALEIGGGISSSICEERNMASGIRMCGVLLGLGLILGRALAGDWHSALETIHDLAADGWPVLALASIALVMERFLRPGPSRPSPGLLQNGLVPALLHVVLACAWVRHLGAWEGLSRR